MAALHITGDNYESEVLNSDKAVLLDFWAEWCDPCRMFGPVIEEIADGEKSIKVGKVNIDEEQKLAEKYKVMSIPTLILIKDGKETARSVGAISKEDVLKFINQK